MGKYYILSLLSSVLKAILTFSRVSLPRCPGTLSRTDCCRSLTGWSATELSSHVILCPLEITYHETIDPSYGEATVLPIELNLVEFKKRRRRSPFGEIHQKRYPSSGLRYREGTTITKREKNRTTKNLDKGALLRARNIKNNAYQELRWFLEPFRFDRQRRILINTPNPKKNFSFVPIFDQKLLSTL